MGVTDHRFLGGAGHYRDSGMMGTPANEHPRCFWRADLDQAAGYLLEILREIRPQVLITYDANGFYGHPDHIQAHRVAMRGAEMAETEGFGPAKIYWTGLPKSVLEAGIESFGRSSDNPFADLANADEFPFGTPDAEIAARIDGSGYADSKMAALRAHATQIPATSWLFSLAGNFGEEFMGVEHYLLAKGERGPGSGPNGWEEDLFAGLPPAPGP
jgi:N-acetyl-1-D-myo-inositol-2-amino-2-deoxy-alpha-D-glucopyranoside deacetylase